MKDALWKGILATVDALPRETGGTRRTAGEFTDNGMGGSAQRSTYSVGQNDGTDKVYEITVSVQESVDHREGFWGPGGHRDGDDPSKRVVVKGEHYYLGDDRPGDRFKGYGGARWEIEFFDGRTVTTHDLWHQGTVPPKWRERYPDNARFVPKEATPWPGL